MGDKRQKSGGSRRRVRGYGRIRGQRLRGRRGGRRWRENGRKKGEGKGEGKGES